MLLAADNSGLILAAAGGIFAGLGVLVTVLLRTNKSTILKETNDALQVRLQTVKDQAADDKVAFLAEIAKRDVAIAEQKGRIDELESGLAGQVSAVVVAAVREVMREVGRG